MKRTAFRTILSVALLVSGALAVWLPAATSYADQPQNIVLIMVDDMDWSDLPFFNPPIQWADENDPIGFGDDPNDPPLNTRIEVKEGRLQTPALNRLAARVMVNPDGTFGSVTDQNSLATVSRSVIPADYVAATAPTPWYPTANADCLEPQRDILVAGSDPDEAGGCKPKHDVLAGAGGINRLATSGIVFPRLYSNSARCGPARGAAMSGRYPERIGIRDNKIPLEGAELTVAELLVRNIDGSEETPLSWDRQGGHCIDDGSAAPYCYTTGQVGKWHIGHKPKTSAPWRQGFEEVVGFKGGGRKYFGGQSLTCNPTTYYCQEKVSDYRVCVTDADCPCPMSQPDCGFRCLGYSAQKYCLDTKPRDCGVASSTKETGVSDSEANNRCRVTGLYGPNGDLTTDTDWECNRWGQYIGPDDWTACHPGLSPRHRHCCKPKGKKKKARGLYELLSNPNKAMKEGADGENIYWAVDRNNEGLPFDKFPCNDDGPVTETGCMYLTRIIRDHSRDFILRHADDRYQELETNPFKPFFLYVSFHAVHNQHLAPTRTRSHYRTLEGLLPKAPAGGSDRFWGIVEEVDAAVGTVLEVLDYSGMCKDDHQTACTADAQCGGAVGSCIKIGVCEDDPGMACLSSGDCNGASCALSNRTIVMFTNDHGAPATGYGNPSLRGGKQTQFEGGARVGLIAWGPGTDIKDDATRPGVLGDDSQDPVASHVDLYPTIGEIAGYAINDEGRLVSNPAHASSYFSDGRSFLDTLTGLVDVQVPSCENNPDCYPGRDYAYSNYHGDGRMVVTPKGFYDGFTVTEAAGHVCAWVVPPDTMDPTIGANGIRGASCHSCDTVGGCPAGVSCEVLGHVCVPDTDVGFLNDHDCLNEADTPDEQCAGRIESYTRCRGDGDCSSGEACKNVRVECDACVPAAWKMRANGTTTGSNMIEGRALFDLTSNPEEQEKKFKNEPFTNLYGSDGRLNCMKDFQVSYAPVCPAEGLATGLDAVIDDLECRHDAWARCQAKSNSETADLDCENTAVEAKEDVYEVDADGLCREDPRRRVHRSSLGRLRRCRWVDGCYRQCRRVWLARRRVPCGNVVRIPAAIWNGC